MRAVDLFAGWGGFSLGAEQAGIDVVWAGNHWRLAVDAHALNHPDTLHVCQDLRQADWSALPEYDLLLASPACQGHSLAAQPGRSASGHTRNKHDALRATAWAVVDCIEVTRPKAVIVENVTAFRRWSKYSLWRQAIETDGYKVDEIVIRASDFGVPQRRNRLFVVASRGGLDLERLLADAKVKETGFGDCIDWEEGKWREISSAPTRNSRICYEAASRLGKAAVQLVSLSTRAKAATGLSVDEPLRTITTKDQWRVVKGDRYRPFSVREYARGMGFPDTYGWPADASRVDAIKGIGNAVCPKVAKILTGRVAASI